MARTYEDAIEWIDGAFEIEDYDSFEDYISDIRDEFENDNLINAIEDTLQERFG